MSGAEKFYGEMPWATNRKKGTAPNAFEEGNIPLEDILTMCAAVRSHYIVKLHRESRYIVHTY
jgi:hypothetical protein